MDVLSINSYDAYDMIGCVKEFVPRCWSEKTAYKNEWDISNPAKNQCDVTAMIVQDVVGGDIVCCKTSDNNLHFWNILSDGEHIDLTESQFDDIIYPLKDNFEIYSREKLVSNDDTYKRYSILRNTLLIILLGDILGEGLQDSRD